MLRCASSGTLKFTEVFLVLISCISHTYSSRVFLIRIYLVYFSYVLISRKYKQQINPQSGFACSRESWYEIYISAAIYQSQYKRPIATICIQLRMRESNNLRSNSNGMKYSDTLNKSLTDWKRCMLNTCATFSTRFRHFVPWSNFWVLGQLLETHSRSLKWLVRWLDPCSRRPGGLIFTGARGNQLMNLCNTTVCK